MKKNGAVMEMAEVNLEALKMNPYPGRGILIGPDETGKHLFQIYWLMGRGIDSRNRIFVDEGGGRLRTELADQSRRPADTSLIIYRAMAEQEKVYVVSNGHQTDNILRAAFLTYDHFEAIKKWDYEPDPPNNTPRISASFTLPGHNLDISIVKKVPFNGPGSFRQVFNVQQFFPGIGFCITTYSGDGNPLPSFSGEPYLLPLRGTAENVAEEIWQTLNPENRVALAVKSIDLKNGQSFILIINKK